MTSSDTRPETAFSTDRARLEAEAAGNAALPEETAAAVTPPGKTNAEVEREILAAPRKTPADDARSAIYAKTTANRGVVDESEASMRDGVQAMLEDTGTSIAPVAASSPAPSAPLDRPGDTITLTVEGREIVVSRSDVERAGVASLQKETNADFRLQRATLAEQSIAARAAALDLRAAEIEASRTPTREGGSAPTGRSDLPTGGLEEPEGTRQALTALLDSDVDGAAKALDKIVADRAEAAVRRVMGNQPPAATTPSTNDEATRVWPQELRNTVGRQVETAFPQLREQPELGQQFTARMAAEMANPTNLAARVDLGLLALSIGQDVLRTARSTPAPQPVANSSDELAARRTLAARVPGVPTSSVPRSVAPAPAGPAPQTRSQIVSSMQKARGQA